MDVRDRVTVLLDLLADKVKIFLHTSLTAFGGHCYRSVRVEGYQLACVVVWLFQVVNNALVGPSCMWTGEVVKNIHPRQKVEFGPSLLVDSSLTLLARVLVELRIVLYDFLQMSDIVFDDSCTYVLYVNAAEYRAGAGLV